MLPAACLQLGQFPFLGSLNCMCDSENLQSVQAMAMDSKAKCHWLVAGLLCALIGSMIHLIILGADLGSVYSSQKKEVNKSEGYVLSTNAICLTYQIVKDARSMYVSDNCNMLQEKSY
jgi:hypothetical protein